MEQSGPQTWRSPAEVTRDEPDRPAQVMAATGAVMTYGELDDLSSRFASVLRRHGVAPGDTTVLLTGNHERTLAVSWAAQRSGLYWTPLNVRWMVDELEHAVRDSGAKAVIAAAPSLALAREVVDRLDSDPLLVTVDEAGSGFASLDDVLAGADRLPEDQESEGCEMLYSSGTTGRPKGVKPGSVGAPFGRPDAVMDALRSRYGIDEQTAFLVATPLFHIASLASALMAQRVGGRVVIADRFSPEGFLATVQDHAVTHTVVVPTIVSRLVELPAATRAEYDTSSLRFFCHGGAPCAPSTKAALHAWLGSVVHESWGATERPGLTLITAEEWERKQGSVGRAVFGVPHVLGVDGVELPAGDVGLVHWETDTPFEYHGDPDKTAASRSAQGWCTVGDLGYLDEDGYLFLTDRAASMIITGGENVYPVEVENVLITHEAVRDVAVVGREHHDLGQEVVAFVEPAEGLVPDDGTAAEIIAFCRERLAGYKCPRSVEFRSEMPRNDTGKLVKRLLV
ncbi:AMP-binding protein [Aeromicrobium sp. CTD01-1L150]|uniref:AMP-binding protein n=1 Tax=Aeromicrobium sp. CTD01-1L150 TaxID=3341830 RepID=UPI0035C15742